MSLKYFLMLWLPFCHNQPTPHQQVRSRRSAYAPADDSEGMSHRFSFFSCQCFWFITENDKRFASFSWLDREWWQYWPRFWGSAIHIRKWLQWPRFWRQSVQGITVWTKELDLLRPSSILKSLNDGNKWYMLNFKLHLLWLII